MKRYWVESLGRGALKMPPCDVQIRHRLVALLACVVTVFPTGSALANNVGENYSWQFETTNDKVNRAYLEDMRQKKQSGYYAAPVYNTYIDRQYNCSVSSSALGNQSSSTAIGNSPTASGHNASSTGNTGTTDVQQGSSPTTSSVSGSQSNTGEVESSASGEIETTVRGDTYQALNSDQNNSGDQSASVTASNACQFGAIN